MTQPLRTSIACLRRADERRAETKVHIKLIDTTASQIAEQMRTDPEYARRRGMTGGQRQLHCNMAFRSYFLHPLAPLAGVSGAESLRIPRDPGE